MNIHNYRLLVPSVLFLGLLLPACSEPVVSPADILARILPPFFFGSAIKVSDCPSDETLTLAEVRNNSVNCLTHVCESRPSTVPVVIREQHIDHRVLSVLGHERDGDRVVLDPPTDSVSCGSEQPVYAEFTTTFDPLYIEDDGAFCNASGTCFQSEDVDEHVRGLIQQ